MKLRAKGKEKILTETKPRPLLTYQCPIVGQMKLRNKTQTHEI